MAKILILEDEEIRREAFIVALGKKGYKEIIVTGNAPSAIKFLEEGGVGVLYLDNDLGPEKQGQGLDVSRYLTQNWHKHEHLEIIIHSWNMYARQVMLSDLVAAGFRVRTAPFNPKKITMPLLH